MQADGLIRQERPHEATIPAKQSIALFETTVGHESPATAWAFDVLGRALFSLVTSKGPIAPCEKLWSSARLYRAHSTPTWSRSSTSSPPYPPGVTTARRPWLSNGEPSRSLASARSDRRDYTNALDGLARCYGILADRARRQETTRKLSSSGRSGPAPIPGSCSTVPITGRRRVRGPASPTRRLRAAERPWRRAASMSSKIGETNHGGSRRKRRSGLKRRPSVCFAGSSMSPIPSISPG